MTETQTLQLHNILQRYVKNDADIKAVAAEIVAVVDKSVGDKKDVFTTGFTTKEVEALKGEIESSSLRVEGKLKSSINELMVWIIAMIFTTATLFFVVSKLVH